MGGPIPEPGLRMDLLHCLSEHVCRRVAKDVETVLLGRTHRLDDVTVGEDVSEVAQLTTDPGDEHGAVTREEVTCRGSLVDGTLARRRHGR